jgi:hypothetical protein
MTSPARVPGHHARLLGCSLALVALSACAQTPPAPATATAPAASAPARATAYAGHFESDCQQLGEAFYTRDLVDLAPADGGTVQARYAKAFHDAEGCTPASLVVVFHMPPARWTFDGTTQVQGRTVDRIQVQPAPGGRLTASQARPGSLEETPDQFLMRRQGTGRGLPVDKAVDASPTKELRLLTSQRLYSSTLEGSADAYPTELDLEGYLSRKPTP